MDRSYIQIPGSETHELPPLLVRTTETAASPALVELAAAMMDDGDFGAAPLSEEQLEHRKFDLAANLAAQYRRLLEHWNWGDSILEWARQCEITFDAEANLRRLLHPDVWPHANRASFVTLLMEKSVPTHGVLVEDAVGLRLTFRQPPPIECFSDQSLFFLNSPVAETAYRTWAGLSTDSPALLPPHRFHFEVFEMGRLN